MQRASQRGRLALAFAAATVLSAVSATAQTNYSWTNFGGGVQAWTISSNWSPSTGYPNLPGDGANVAHSTATALSISIPTNVRIGSLGIGASTNTSISGAGTLFFEPDGAIQSGGTGLNTISASVGLGTGTYTNDTTLTINGTNSISFSSGLIGQMDNTGTVEVIRQIYNSLTGNAAVVINGLTLSQAGATAPGTVWLNGRGKYVLNGFINEGGIAGGNLVLAKPQDLQDGHLVPIDHTDPTCTFAINVVPAVTDMIVWHRSTIEMGVDNPLGTATVTLGTPTQYTGFNLVPIGGDRVLSNNFRVGQSMTVKGEHNVTFTGMWMQENNDRGVINLLPYNHVNPADPTNRKVIVNGTVYGGYTNEFNMRIMFDGSGLTEVNGRVMNFYDDGTLIFEDSTYGNLTKRGTGVLNLNNLTNTYRGATLVEGGILQFAGAGAYGDTGSITVRRGGAICVLTGTTDSTFIARINNAGTASYGALALATADAAANLDFTGSIGGAVNLSGIGVASMSIGAQAAGVTFTGTITETGTRPYRLGGGGTLTINNPILVNGTAASRGATITNGGTVVLNGDNTYTGFTRIEAPYIQPGQERAKVGGGNFGTLSGGAQALMNPTTLIVDDLANGGVASSIGAAGVGSTMLQLHGGTLRYVGTGDSTDRIFTLGSKGGTIDSSGAGPIAFTGTTAVNTLTAAAMAGGMVGTIDDSRGASPVPINRISQLADVNMLTLGMVVNGPYIPPGTTITGIESDEVPGVGGRIMLSQTPTNYASGLIFYFTNQNRALTLTGTNTGNNRLSGDLGDASAVITLPLGGGTVTVTGTVAVNKTGPGKWILDGDNTYTGGTTVSAGTLVVGNVSGIGTGPLTVADGRAQLQPGLLAAVKVTAMNVTAPGKVDVTDNDMVIDYTAPAPSPLQTVRQMAWDGRLMTSSTTPSGTRVGYAEASVLFPGGGTFSGVTVDASMVLIKYTYAGDANLDGQVDITDLGLLATNWQATGVWTAGDFDYSGLIDITDLGLLATNWQKGAGNPLGPQSLGEALAVLGLPGVVVPEPAAVALLAGAMGLLGRRRRRV